MFCIGGNTTDRVCKWPHVGHMIDSNGGDKAGKCPIRRSSFVGQINDVLYLSGQLDDVTKLKLLKSRYSILC